MNKELTLEVCGESLKLQLQRGFFNTQASATPIHDHKYTEIQVVANGKAYFRVDGTDIALSENEMMIVPSDTFHALSGFEKGTKRVAFQVSKPCASTKKISLPEGIARAVVAEVDSFCSTMKSKRICAYLALLCSELFAQTEPPFEKSADRAFLVDEYFSKNYNDPDASLDKIADILGVSKKQAEREIFRITGNNFRTELSARRIRAAKLLMDKGDMSLSAVAERVGYRSYSGFWKAFGKFGGTE